MKYFVRLGESYNMVHTEECRVVKQARKRFGSGNLNDSPSWVWILDVDTPLKAGLDKPVFYCQVCKPKGDHRRTYGKAGL